MAPWNIPDDHIDIQEKSLSALIESAHKEYTMDRVIYRPRAEAF